VKLKLKLITSGLTSKFTPEFSSLLLSASTLRFAFFNKESVAVVDRALGMSQLGYAYEYFFAQERNGTHINVIEIVKSREFRKNAKNLQSTVLKKVIKKLFRQWKVSLLMIFNVTSRSIKFHSSLRTTMLHFTTLNKSCSFYRKFPTSDKFIIFIIYKKILYIKKGIKNILILTASYYI